MAIQLDKDMHSNEDEDRFKKCIALTWLREFGKGIPYILGLTWLHHLNHSLNFALKIFILFVCRFTFPQTPPPRPLSPCELIDIYIYQQLYFDNVYPSQHCSGSTENDPFKKCFRRQLERRRWDDKYGCVSWQRRPPAHSVLSHFRLFFLRIFALFPFFGLWPFGADPTSSSLHYFDVTEKIKRFVKRVSMLWITHYGLLR